MTPSSPPRPRQSHASSSRPSGPTWLQPTPGSPSHWLPESAGACHFAHCTGSATTVIASNFEAVRTVMRVLPHKTDAWRSPGSALFTSRPGASLLESESTAPQSSALARTRRPPRKMPSLRKSWSGWRSPPTANLTSSSCPPTATAWSILCEWPRSSSRRPGGSRCAEITTRMAYYSRKRRLPQRTRTWPRGSRCRINGLPGRPSITT